VKICKVEDCYDKNYGRGYCQKHYRKLFLGAYQKALSRGTYMGRGVCKIKKCCRGVYAHDYCRKHYAQTKRIGHTIRNKKQYEKICKVSSCKKKSSTLNYCRIHYIRISKRGHARYIGNSGKHNHRWNGGISMYKNAYLMKKNRLIKIKETNGKCELCSSEGKVIHHKDRTTINHNINNLLFLCCLCHRKLHSGPTKTSKYKRLYGFKLFEIAQKLNCEIYKVRQLHKKSTLRNRIKLFSEIV